MNSTVEDRLIDLEKNCSYLEDRCENLSDALTAASAEITQLKRRLASIEAGLDAPDVRPIERPPHY